MVSTSAQGDLLVLSPLGRMVPGSCSALAQTLLIPKPSHMGMSPSGDGARDKHLRGNLPSRTSLLVIVTDGAVRVKQHVKQPKLKLVLTP